MCIPTTVVCTILECFMLITDGLFLTTLTCSCGMLSRFLPTASQLTYICRYNAHINIECVMSLAAEKYITKYVHKGPNQAIIEVQCQDCDEVSDQGHHYIGATKAAWHLFEFPVVHQHPPVVCLQVHLPGNHLTIFDPSESLDTILACGECEQSMLIAFFAANQSYSSACQHMYQEFPQHFVWHREPKVWHPQQTAFAIGCLYFITPMCNAPSGAGSPMWTHGVYQGNNEGPGILDSCRGQRPTMRQGVTLGQAHTQVWSL